MRKIFIFLGAFGLVVLTGLPVLSQGKPTKMGRVGCPRCVNDGSPTSQSLQKADELYADFKTKEALAELLKVLQIDAQNTEALSKIARVHIDFGDGIPESSPDWQAKRLKEYQTAEDYARKAVKSDPDSTWGHFYVAASLGKIAMLSSIPKQIDLSREIQSEVERSIALDPENGFAYHVYGVWHRRMAEIGQMSRVAASVFLGRSVPKGSMEKSVEYLNKAVSLNPKVISHRLELAKTYIAMENWQLARNSLKTAEELPVQFSDDRLHKTEAQRLLQEIKDN
jgi:tetratricopeptide (TPR) repeat protein